MLRRWLTLNAGLTREMAGTDQVCPMFWNSVASVTLPLFVAVPMVWTSGFPRLHQMSGNCVSRDEIVNGPGAVTSSAV